MRALVRRKQIGSRRGRKAQRLQSLDDPSLRRVNRELGHLQRNRGLGHKGFEDGQFPLKNGEAKGVNMGADRRLDIGQRCLSVSPSPTTGVTVSRDQSTDGVIDQIVAVTYGGAGPVAPPIFASLGITVDQVVLAGPTAVTVSIGTCEFHLGQSPSYDAGVVVHPIDASAPAGWQASGIGWCYTPSFANGLMLAHVTGAVNPALDPARDTVRVSGTGVTLDLWQAHVKEAFGGEGNDTFTTSGLHSCGGRRLKLTTFALRKAA